MESFIFQRRKNETHTANQKRILRISCLGSPWTSRTVRHNPLCLSLQFLLCLGRIHPAFPGCSHEGFLRILIVSLVKNAPDLPEHFYFTVSQFVTGMTIEIRLKTSLIMAWLSYHYS